MNKTKRYGYVGIIVHREGGVGGKIQTILERHCDIILGRMGLPNLGGDGESSRLSIITLIIHADSDELGSLTGQLGKLPGVTVKSGLSKMPEEDRG